MLSLLLSDPIIFIMGAVAIIAAISVHEFAHAWMAERLGDPTPKLQGRLTINPLAHLDPFGTILLFLVGFGWGKPVQFDPYNLDNPRRDSALISLAGPVSNLIFATAVSLLFFLSSRQFIPVSIDIEFAFLLIRLNVILAVFNLIPIHPLDGGKILVGMLPAADAHQVDRFLKQYGLILLLVLILPVLGGSSPVFAILSPIINILMRLFLPGVHIV